MRFGDQILAKGAEALQQPLSEFGQRADQMGRGNPNFSGWLGFELEKVKKRAVEWRIKRETQDVL